MVEREGMFDAAAELQPISEGDLASLPTYAAHSEVPALRANLPLVKLNETNPPHLKSSASVLPGATRTFDGGT
jgi:hypothetical protein